MSRLIRLILAFTMAAALLPVLPVMADPPPNYDEVNCTQVLHGVYGTQASGAKYCIVVPPNWNKNLVIFAHGYVDPTTPGPLSIPYEQLVLPDNTTTIPGLVTSLGFAFGITSYSKKGLAVVQGIADVADLAVAFKALHPETRHVYLIGASEGGLVTALAIERNPGNIFSGGVATCGPVGDFQKQINYWGDFRVVFDFFFKDQNGQTLIPADPVTILPALYDQWRVYQTVPLGPGPTPLMVSLPFPGPLQMAIGGLILQGEQQPAGLTPTLHLFGVTRAPVDAGNPAATMVETSLGLLGYNVLATNDGILTLGGQPYNNQLPFTTYHDAYPLNPIPDALLNAGVFRTPSANPDLSAYQTTGKLKAPLVTLHTTGDPIVPYWHETLYRAKVFSSGSAWKYINIPVNRYGHCNFKSYEALLAFFVMVLRSGFTQIPLSAAAATLSNPSDRAAFLEMAAPYATPGYKINLPFVTR